MKEGLLRLGTRRRGRAAEVCAATASFSLILGRGHVVGSWPGFSTPPEEQGYLRSSAGAASEHQEPGRPGCRALQVADPQGKNLSVFKHISQCIPF